MQKRTIRELSAMAVLAAVLVAGILIAAGGTLTEPASTLLVALVWPFLLVAVLFIFRERSLSLIVALEDRIRSGSGFKLGAFEIAADTRLIPSPSEAEPVTLSNIALLHTSFVSESGTRRMNDGRLYYQIEVVVIAPPDVMARVKHVTYRLPDAWPKEKRVITTVDVGSRFKMKELANGTAIVLAEIQFRDRTERLFLNRFITLSPSGPRI